MSLDTLKYTKTLESVGVARNVAEAHAQAMREIVVPDLATKADMIALKGDLNAVGVGLRAEIRTATEQLRTEMLRLSIGQLLATVTIVGLIVKFIK